MHFSIFNYLESLKKLNIDLPSRTKARFCWDYGMFTGPLGWPGYILTKRERGWAQILQWSAKVVLSSIFFLLWQKFACTELEYRQPPGQNWFQELLGLSPLVVNTVKSICWGATLGRRDLSKGGAGQKVLQRSNSWSSYACVLLDFSLSILPGQKHYSATRGEQKGLLY